MQPGVRACVRGLGSSVMCLGFWVYTTGSTRAKLVLRSRPEELTQDQLGATSGTTGGSDRPIRASYLHLRGRSAQRDTPGSTRTAMSAAERHSSTGEGAWLPGRHEHRSRRGAEEQRSRGAEVQNQRRRRSQPSGKPERKRRCRCASVPTGENRKSERNRGRGRKKNRNKGRGRERKRL